MDTLTAEEVWLLREKYGGVASPEFAADRKRLADGEPLAYLIGSIPFLNTTIFLDSRPLIPRPETEYWVGLVVNRYKNRPALSVLDLCAGSGCIGVALAKNVPGATVDCIEIDDTHHETIRKNVRANDIPADRVHVYGGDLFERAPSRYDLIVSNPPYIGTDAVRDVAASVLEHEPHRALFAGPDGLSFIRRIVTEAPNHLTEQGELFLEHEPRHQNGIAKIARLCPYGVIESIKDQYGITRVTHLAL